MKNDGAICLIFLLAKHLGHGSRTMGRGSLFEWVAASQGDC